MPVSAPMIYAQEFGYFKKAGLEIELKEYPLGKVALEEMSAGKIDIACAAVTPLVNKFMLGQDFKIFASGASSTGMAAIVARVDHGITNIASLAGKKVGLTRGTSGEFFFETLRILNRIPRSSVAIEDLSLNQMMSQFTDGSVDAVSIWEPNISQLQNSLSNRVAVLYGNGQYTFTWQLVALPKIIETRRAELEKLLSVLFEVAARIEQSPEKAEAQLTERLGKRGQELALGLAQMQMEPRLGQELLVQMEAEARWILHRDNKVQPIPNFLKSLDTSLLKKVRPASVTVIE